MFSSKIATCYKNLSFCAFSLLSLFAVFAAPLLVPGNPDFLLPLLPECLTLAALCCFGFVESKDARANSLRISSLEKILIFCIICLVMFYIFPRMLLSLMHTPHQVWNPCENIAPSLFVRLECYLHGAIIQFPGPRQFYMIVTAVLLGLVAFAMARISPEVSKKLLYSFAICAVLYCLIVQMGIYAGKDTLLPNFLGKSEFGRSRFALIIPNPGWVWPYLAPGLAVLIWLTLTSRKKLTQALSALGLLIVAYGIFQTGQRGGLLLLAILFGSGALFVFNEKIDIRARPIRFGLLTASFLALATLFGPWVIEFLMQKIGRAEFIDHNRLSIWSLALPHVLKHHIFLGFGYASWFQEFRSIAIEKGAPLFDTAHNLYVQMIFEHGLIGTILICSCLLGVLLLTIRNLRASSSGKMLAIFASLIFLVATVVQELDYIRPIYYIHALFWGVLLGFREVQEERIATATSSKNQFESTIAVYSLHRLMFVFATLGVSILAVAVLVVFYFPFGVFPFEGDLSRKTATVERWLGPNARLTSFGMSNSWNFNIVSIQKTDLVLSEGARSCSFALSSGEVKQIKLSNLSKWYPQAIFLTFAAATPDSSRLITARISYPPLVQPDSQLNLGSTIINSNNCP